MSVSGIGGSSNDLYALWAEMKARAAASSEKSTSAAAALGTSLQAGSAATSGIQTVTSASGSMPMNSQDSSSFQQSISALAGAMKSGDLTAAQSAYAQAKSTLASSGVHGHHHHRGGGVKNATGASSDGSAASPFAQDFEAIGKALQNGDLAGAESAFSQLGTLLAGSPNKLTDVPVGANSPVNPMGGAIDLTA